ncbi:MAG: preprotein translocase subunit YajC [Betaproteobacteria bacterium]|nr:preprotein translocase subunit YajC [Betaproteobacteria bacterium]
MKIILLVLGLLLVCWILRSYRGRLRGDGPRPASGAGEDMVRCAHCGVHLPRGESIVTQGSFYCSPEHQREHPPR